MYILNWLIWEDSLPNTSVQGGDQARPFITHMHTSNGGLTFINTDCFKYITVSHNTAQYYLLTNTTNEHI